MDKELTTNEMSAVLALAERVSKLKQLKLTGVGVITNWLLRRVIPSKKQVHLGLEYSGIQDPTYESNHHIKMTQLEGLLGKMFQSTDG
jgi:hypothetical protein